MKELKNYEKLRKELTKEFGPIKWYNDKRKSFERRIKIIDVYDIDKMYNFLKDKGYNVKEHIIYKYRCLVVYFGK